jgi:hypothetical protein
MPRLRNMLGDTGTVEIAVPDDEPLVVTYRRGVLTPRLQIKLLSLQGRMQAGQGKQAAGADDLATLVEVFASLIESWNLTDEQGAVIPTTTEALQDVDMSILTLVMQEIGRAVSPDPLRSGGSSNGSSPTAGLEPLRITSAS